MKYTPEQIKVASENIKKFAPTNYRRGDQAPIFWHDALSVLWAAEQYLLMLDFWKSGLTPALQKKSGLSNVRLVDGEK